MIQTDQDDEVIEFTGPLLTSLTEFVTAVAVEEDCNTFRKHLLQQASDFQNALQGATIQDVLLCDPIGEQDIHLVIGALRWIAMPRYKRPTQNCPTRSLKVWLAAVIMHELGFETTVSLECLTTSSDYAKFVGDPSGLREFSDVILVTASVGSTDPMMLKGMVTQSTELRPQITTLGGLPYAAFNRLQETHNRAQVEDLVDIWKTSYQSAQRVVRLPVVTEDRLVLLEAIGEDARVTRERHKTLVHIWSPHLGKVLGSPMTDFVPSSLTVESWSSENIKGYFELEERGEGMFVEEEVRANAFKLLAIVSGTIYWIAAMSLIPNPSQANSQNFIEVAFQPNLLHGGTLFRWARVVGEALHGMLEMYTWKDFILELATGISPLHLSTQCIPERPAKVDKDVDPAGSCVFGAQANGIFAVSDFVAGPSTQVDDVLRFHVGTGRILNLPVDESGFMHSSANRTPTTGFQTHPGPSIDVLRRQPLSHNPLRDQSLRIDAEPDWTGNPKTIQFSVRSGGIQIAHMNLGRIIWRLSYGRVSCNCTTLRREVKVPLSEGWKIETLDSLLHAPHNGSVPCSAHVKDEAKMMIDVYGDKMHRLFAVGMLHCRRMAISTSCIECAYEGLASKKSRKESTALIIG